MRLAAVLILLLALLGVSTSLGAAWFIGGVQPEWSGVHEVRIGQSGEWYVRHWQGIGQSIWSGRSLTDYGNETPGGDPVAAPGPFAQSPRFLGDSLMEYRAGWPTRSWRVQLRTHPSDYGSYGTHDVIGGGLIGRSSPAPGQQSFAHFLPFQPSGPMLALDVAFWALVWFAIVTFVAVAGLIRRRVRLRRNRCTMCGYDLRGLDMVRCSECGAARGARGPMLGNRLLGALAAVLLLLVITQITVGAKVASLSHGPHALHLAARDGDLRAIKRHLANGVNVDVLVDPNHDAAGTTPLIWAMAGGQIEAVELLLDRGAAPGAKDADGRSALALAVAQADDRLLTAMLKAGADPNQRVWMSMTPLEYVIGRERSVQCARVLIDAGADVNHSETDGAPLTTAARRNDVAVARLLIAAGAHLNAPVENLPIVSAVRRGGDEMSRLLIESGAEIARAELDLLRLAVESGNVELVTLLLVHGAPRAVVGEAATPLHVAVARCDTDMVRFLTTSGFDPTVPDEQGRTPFEQAIEASLIAGEYDEIVRILDAAVRAWYRDGGDADGG